MYSCACMPVRMYAYVCVHHTRMPCIYTHLYVCFIQCHKFPNTCNECSILSHTVTYSTHANPPIKTEVQISVFEVCAPVNDLLSTTCMHDRHCTVHNIYIYIYIHTYIHTYIHIYIYIYIDSLTHSKLCVRSDRWRTARATYGVGVRWELPKRWSRYMHYIYAYIHINTHTHT